MQLNHPSTDRVSSEAVVVVDNTYYTISKQAARRGDSGSQSVAGEDDDVRGDAEDRVWGWVYGGGGAKLPYNP